MTLFISGLLTRLILSGLIINFLKWRRPWWGTPFGAVFCAGICIYAGITDTAGGAGIEGYLGFFSLEFLFGLLALDKVKAKKYKRKGRKNECKT